MVFIVNILKVNCNIITVYLSMFCVSCLIVALMGFNSKYNVVKTSALAYLVIALVSYAPICYSFSKYLIDYNLFVESLEAITTISVYAGLTYVCLTGALYLFKIATKKIKNIEN